ncbi:MAG: aminotransferase class V-fold PLP-dependent enzyme [Candidatus Cloacimonadota bacterium]|nr:aminotransferase class V-fold PLP-dependent enzyme [Candidatus Cloacimonadota bacterium]
MIYLDNAATSFPKAPGIAKAVYNFLENVGANAGRSSHSSAQKASYIVYETREKLAALLNVKNSEDIIFTMNTTQALNTVILGFLEKGDTVLTSTMEHNSVMRPLQYLKKTRDIDIIQFQCNKFGFPVWKDFLQKIAQKPKLLITTGASNVTGSLFPFSRIAAAAKKQNVTYCLDAAQILGIFPIDIKNSGIDIVCFPGHKGLLGPAGTGGFYCNPNINLRPLTYGGTGSKSDSEIQPEFKPDKYESGTQNVAGLAGLNAALDFLFSVSIPKILERKSQITCYFIKKLQQIEELKLVSPTNIEKQLGVLSVISPQLSLSQITTELDKNDIATRLGLHCAPSAHKTIGTLNLGGTIRFSPGYFTTLKQIENTIKILKNIIRKLKYD